MDQKQALQICLNKSITWLRVRDLIVVHTFVCDCFIQFIKYVNELGQNEIEIRYEDMRKIEQKTISHQYNEDHIMYSILESAYNEAINRSKPIIQ